MKKQLHPALFLVFCMLGVNTFSQTVLWAKKGSSEGFENGNAVVADDSGNVYVTGQIEFTTVFDNHSLTSYGQHDIFVAKYGPDGVIKWIRHAGGPDGDIGLGIGIDDQHNVYITGEIEQTVRFSNSITLTSSGGNDVFVAKYDANGNAVWAKKFGSNPSSDKGRGMAVSRSGNVYVTGNFFGTVNVGSTTLSSSGGSEIFIVKYDSNGNVVWAKKAGGSGQDRGNGLAIDGSENVYVTGYFTSPATFRSTTITNSGKLSAFIAKYNSGGSFHWVKAAGDCCDTTQGNAVTVDANGDVYITGSFAAQTKFSSTVLTSSGSTDIFVAKYSSSGSLVWAKKAGGPKEDAGNAIAYDATRNRIYVTGFVASAGSSGSISYPFTGYKDVFTGSFSAYSGSTKWVTTYGGHWRDIGLACATNSQGNLYSTGLFNGTAQFGGITLTSYPNSYWADFYIAKILPPAPRLGAPLLADEESGQLLPAFTAYPNPFSSALTIHSENPFSYRMFTLTGTLVERRENLNGEVACGEQLPAGIYLLEISDGNSVRSVRVIKTAY